MFLYQQPVWFPGWVFFLVMAGGLVLLIRRWRGWGRYAALPWGVAVVNLVLPIAAHELDYRYAISAVPFACLALGLACIRKLGAYPARPVWLGGRGELGFRPMDDTQWRTHRLELDDQTLREWDAVVLAPTGRASSWTARPSTRAAAASRRTTACCCGAACRPGSWTRARR